MASSEPVLAVKWLDAYYGQSHVLQGVEFEMGSEPIAIIGRNGMGKTTLCKAIMGMSPPEAKGSIRFEGTQLVGKPSYRIAAAGIGYVPQGRRLFPSLTVDEHLRMIGRISISLSAFSERLGAKAAGERLDELLAKHLPGFRLDPDLRELILRRRPLDRNFGALTQNVLGRMIARQTGYYWGTSGHTPEPVVVGAIGPGAELFRGYQDNTEFGKHLHLLIQGK